MSMSGANAANDHSERHKRKLVVVHNALDDEGGADHLAAYEAHEASEGGTYVLPAIRDRIDQTRFDIEELDIITMDLPKNSGDPKAKYLDVIATAAPKGIQRVHKAFSEGHKVLALGGNHVRALDVIGAMQACHELGIPFGLIWIDQHLDFNTPETTPSGNIHGMVSAVLQGRGAKELLALLKICPFVEPCNILYIGPREDQMDGHETKDTDGKYAEGTEAYCFAELLEKGAQCFTVDGMKVGGQKVDSVSDEAKAALKNMHNRIKNAGGRLWCEWDVDVVDTQDMPAAVMKNDDGLSRSQMRDLFDFMNKNCDVDGMGVSEVCPEKDINAISKELIAEGVSKILGMEKGEVIQLAGKEPVKRKRVVDFVKWTAAGILALITGHELIKPPVQPQKHIVVSKAEKVQRTQDMMYKFVKHDVRKQIETYRMAQEGPHEQREYGELLRKVRDAEALASGKEDRNSMLEYVLAELYDVLGSQKGTEMFQRIITRA